MKQSPKPRPAIDALFAGIIAGDRVKLAQAITLIESRRADDEALADALLEKIMPHSGRSIRVGITGIPGVGKSTFIESLGSVILKTHKKLAVLSIDPTSPIGGGSILGDKTRMETLSKDPRAFIRPSASQDAAGGVAARTRESLLLCEAAGYDVIIIETVGVGQSEYAVKDMVDFFLLLMLAGAGDDLQGIKKGIMELADAIAITKADGDNTNRARQAQTTYAQAMHAARNETEAPTVLLTSALSHTGIDPVWEVIIDTVTLARANGAFDQKRNHQYIAWLHDQFAILLKADVQQYADVRSAQALLETQVISGNRSPRNAAAELLNIYHQQFKTRTD